MANGRSAGKGKRDTGRDGGGFVALPWTVLDSAAYLALSMHARALLLEVARQFHGDDNGRMLLSRAHLLTRGWSSNDMILKAKAELLEAGFIFETVKGCRPNKASWYAVTWRKLDRHSGYDTGVDRMFEQSAYRKTAPKSLCKNAVLTPPHGAERPSIAPPHGVETPPPTPPHGAIEPVSEHFSTPPHGHPLDMPSAGAAVGGAAASAAPSSRMPSRPVLTLVEGTS